MTGHQKEDADVIGKARESSNWFVGLAGAAVGGGLAKLDMVEKFPLGAKVFYVLATAAFLWSIVSGIFYYFQLLSLAQAKDKVDQEEKKNPKDQTKLNAATAARVEANKKLSTFHTGTLLSFPFACLFTVACLGLVLFTPTVEANKPPVPPPEPSNHFTLVTVPVHASGRLLHDHTFLLDQQQGAIWLMVCQHDKTVEFKRVKQLKLDGTLEDENPASSTQLATPPTRTTAAR